MMRLYCILRKSTKYELFAYFSPLFTTYCNSSFHVEVLEHSFVGLHYTHSVRRLWKVMLQSLIVIHIINN